jgi:hypothetical protein
MRCIAQTYIRFRLSVFRIKGGSFIIMGLLLGQAFESPIPLLLLPVLLGCTVLVCYVVYQRYLHPLAEFPGPFLASITDLWQVHQYLTLKQPYNLTDLHEQYGPFIRYGPDKLSVTSEDAISLVYQKGGKLMPKTEFYDAYGAAHPNVFGMRDEDVSSPLSR